MVRTCADLREIELTIGEHKEIRVDAVLYACAIPPALHTHVGIERQARTTDYRRIRERQATGEVWTLAELARRLSSPALRGAVHLKYGKGEVASNAYSNEVPTGYRDGGPPSELSEIANGSVAVVPPTVRERIQRLAADLSRPGRDGCELVPSVHENGGGRASDRSIAKTITTAPTVRISCDGQSARLKTADTHSDPPLHHHDCSAHRRFFQTRPRRRSGNGDGTVASVGEDYRTQLYSQRVNAQARRN